MKGSFPLHAPGRRGQHSRPSTAPHRRSITCGSFWCAIRHSVLNRAFCPGASICIQTTTPGWRGSRHRYGSRPSTAVGQGGQQQAVGGVHGDDSDACLWTTPCPNQGKRIRPSIAAQVAVKQRHRRLQRLASLVEALRPGGQQRVSEPERRVGGQEATSQSGHEPRPQLIRSLSVTHGVEILEHTDRPLRADRFLIPRHMKPTTCATLKV